MALGKLVPGRKSGERNATHTVAVRVTGYDTSAADPKDHVAIGTLLSDVGDKRSGETVKVYLRPIDQAGKKHVRKEIGQFEKGDKSRRVNATQPGGVIAFESCFVDRDGRISARWPHALANEPTVDGMTSGPNRIFSTMISVSPVFKSKSDDGSESQFQRVTMLGLRGAALIASSEELKKKLAVFLRPHANYQGTPGVVVRSVGPDGSAEAIELRLRFKKGENGAEGRMETPEEAIERMSKPEGDVETSLFDGIDQEIKNAPQGTVFDVIPTVSWGMGRTSLPTADNNFRDQSAPFRFGQKDVEHVGYTQAVLAIRERDNRQGSFFAHYVRPTSSQPKLFAIENIVTEDLPADLREKLAAKGVVASAEAPAEEPANQGGQGGKDRDAEVAAAAWGV